MQNVALLRAAARTGLPVLLKRGRGATYAEWLLAAEYVLREGNPNVVLCERGIRTFEPYTRATFDVSAFPALKNLTICGGGGSVPRRRAARPRGAHCAGGRGRRGGRRHGGDPPVARKRPLRRRAGAFLRGPAGLVERIRSVYQCVK